jgi:hypothetical protein
MFMQSLYNLNNQHNTIFVLYLNSFNDKATCEHHCQFSLLKKLMQASPYFTQFTAQCTEYNKMSPNTCTDSHISEKIH